MDYDYFINRFEQRAAKKRIQSYFFLGVSVMLIFILFIVLHSGMNNYKNLKTHIEDFTSWTGDVVLQRRMLEQAQEELVAQIKIKEADSLTFSTYTTRLDSLVLKGAFYLDTIASVNKDIISSANTGSGKTSLLVDTSARILLAVIGFFLIQIFLKLYRYNMETADFYTSLADSISVLKLENAHIRGVDFEALTKILNPSQIQLEIPKTPTFGDPSGFFKAGG